MKLSDDMLQAYFHGEVDLVTRAEIEAAIARDPGLARLAEDHRVSRAAAPALAVVRPAAKPVPRPKSPQTVIEPAAETAPVATVAPVAPDLLAAITARWKFPPWGLPAAALLLGLIVGKFWLGRDAPYAETESGLVARGELAWALSGQLSGDAGTGAVRIGSSFRDRNGAWCRTFRLQHQAPFAGLACRSGEDWQLPLVIAATPGEIGSHEVTVMPMAVLRAVDAAIEGEPMDAPAEIAARDAGWKAQPAAKE
jgi:hypothetical protein